ncbi:MAG: DUF2173 family protein [Armatimonadota bacterium]|nr:DUF2173 family protein [Armatimonadota bacterium]
MEVKSISLDELVNLEGVVLACEFTADGKCVDFKARGDVTRELADKSSEYIATVTMLFNTLAGSFTELSKMNWIPQRGWLYSGGDWTVVVGGSQAVLAETAKADISRLFDLLVGRRVERLIRPSI